MLIVVNLGPYPPSSGGAYPPPMQGPGGAYPPPGMPGGAPGGYPQGMPGGAPGGYPPPGMPGGAPGGYPPSGMPGMAGMAGAAGVAGVAGMAAGYPRPGGAYPPPGMPGGAPGGYPPQGMPGGYPPPGGAPYVGPGISLSASYSLSSLLLSLSSPTSVSPSYHYNSHVVPSTASWICLRRSTNSLCAKDLPISLGVYARPSFYCSR